MDMAAAFADIGLAFNAAFGGPFYDAEIITQSDMDTAYDIGGSIIPGAGDPTRRTCKAQVDQATEAMRATEGYTQQTRRIIVLAATLDGGINTDDTIEILAGPFAGVWMIDQVGRDTVAAGWDLMGRPDGVA